MTKTKPGDSQKELRQHNSLDSLLTSALMREHPEWGMETIREAALICSNTLLLSDDKSTFVNTSTQIDALLDELGRDLSVQIDALLDELGRDLSVLGLENHGFSTTAQKKLREAAKQISILSEAYTQAQLSTIANEVLEAVEDYPEMVGEEIIGKVEAIPVSAIKEIQDKFTGTPDPKDSVKDGGKDNPNTKTGEGSE